MEHETEEIDAAIAASLAEDKRRLKKEKKERKAKQRGEADLAAAMTKAGAKDGESQHHQALGATAWGPLARCTGHSAQSMPRAWNPRDDRAAVRPQDHAKTSSAK